MNFDLETDFFNGLIELQYGQEDLRRMKELSEKISWAQGWPENNLAFWNAEAFMWQRKIDKEKRELIEEELAFLDGKRNLDLGCGAYSYLKSVGLDFSEKMLKLNEKCTEKIVADLEKKLPLENNSFDSVTVIFLLNYVKNYSSLLLEIKRVLKDKGNFVMVLGNVNHWQKQKEINGFDFNEWKEVLEKVGFNVNCYEKEGLWFFRCEK